MSGVLRLRLPGHLRPQFRFIHTCLPTRGWEVSKNARKDASQSINQRKPPGVIIRRVVFESKNPEKTSKPLEINRLWNTAEEQYNPPRKVQDPQQTQTPFSITRVWDDPERQRGPRPRSEPEVQKGHVPLIMKVWNNPDTESNPQLQKGWKKKPQGDVRSEGKEALRQPHPEMRFFSGRSMKNKVEFPSDITASERPRGIFFFGTPRWAASLDSVEEQFRKAWGKLEFRAAIVDAIPLSPNVSTNANTSDRYDRHGYSYLVHWQMMRERRISVEAKEQTVDAMRFLIGPTLITVPLANTLFQTGKKHTSTPAGLSQISFFSAKAALNAGYVIDLPLVPLTEPTQVVESTGNILRSVWKEDRSDVVPASTALEASVAKMYKEKHAAVTEQGKLEIFAFVSKDKHTANSISSSSRPTGYRIYRLLSGGGGWGEKIGLLSLDPQDCGPWADHSHAIAEEYTGTELSNALINPGDWVTFAYAAPEKATESQHTKMSFQAIRKLDEVEPEPQEDDSYFVEGWFGACSEEGFAVQRADKDQRPTFSKRRIVDVPGASVNFIQRMVPGVVKGVE